MRRNVGPKSGEQGLVIRCECGERLHQLRPGLTVVTTGWTKGAADLHLDCPKCSRRTTVRTIEQRGGLLSRSPSFGGAP